MTAIGHVVKTMTFTLLPTGDVGSPVAYECAVTSVKETATRSTVTTQTACPDGALQDVGPTSWSLDVSYHAEYAPGNLHRLLLDNDGVEAAVSWEPDPVGDPGRLRTGTVKLVAAGSDFTVGAFAAAQVTLPVVGTLTTVDPV